MTIKPIIFGISGTELSPEELGLFQKNEVTGFILFARNIESREQLLQLTASLKSLYPDRDVPIFTDQEGDRVARLKPPIAEKTYPTAKYFADLYDTNPEQAKQEVYDNYFALMTELKSFGIDSPCAPVCDIFYQYADDVIGDRAFGDNADKVINLCKAAIQGILDAGGMPFLKHIPGHGRSAVDSHTDLPTVTTELAELKATDFKVFQALSKEFGEQVMGMTAHIVYPVLDPNLSATISPTVINYIRDEIGFTGTLVSDDIGMGALHGEAGQKYALLQRVLRFIAGNRDWKKELSESINNLFDINTTEFDNGTMSAKCKELAEQTKPEFLSSLWDVTTNTLEAGCEYVLHCSGDLEEMITVLGAVTAATA